MSTTTTTTTNAPTPEQHFNLRQFIAILLHLAPAIAAPFVPAGQGQNVLNAEAPIAEAIAETLDNPPAAQ